MRKHAYIVFIIVALVVCGVLIWLDQRETARERGAGTEKPAAAASAIPAIPDGDTPQSRELAATARKLRDSVRALPTVKDKRELHAAKQIIKAESGKLSQAGAEALPVLDPFLSDPRVDVRLSGLSTLGEMRLDAAAPLLCKAYKDKDAAVRSSALMWLAQIKPYRQQPERRQRLIEESRDVIYSALQSNDVATRNLARQALLSITGTTHGFTAEAPADRRQQALEEIRKELYAQ